MSRKSEMLRKRERMLLTLDRVIDHFLMVKQVKGCSHKTLVVYRADLSRFLRFLQKRDHSLRVADLTVDDPREFIASMQGEVAKWPDHPFIRPQDGDRYSPYTIHQYVRVLRTFSNWLHREGYTSGAVFETLDLPKLPYEKIEVLTEQELDGILSAINPDTFLGARLYAMVLTFLDTGMRLSELVGLRLGDVYWDRGIVKVHGKGNKERFVPVGLTAKTALQRYIQTFRPRPAVPDNDYVFLAVDGYPLRANSVVNIMRRLGRRSGVPRLHAHLLRHTCGVRYILAGGDQVSLQMFLGHSSGEMTRHYIQLNDEHMIAQHRRFSPVDTLNLQLRRFRGIRSYEHQMGKSSSGGHPAGHGQLSKASSSPKC